MHQYRHHYAVSCYEHSVFVSYISFRLARRLGFDSRTAARGGLLHDLFLYDSRDKSNIEGWQCFFHPKAALKNAGELCELSDKEENIILSHMWPLSPVVPKSKEAMVVNVADKYCAILEVLRVWHRMKIRRHVPSPTTKAA
jgi:uncharacterized protein